LRAIIDSDYDDLSLRFENAKLEPIGGWDWLESHRQKQYPEQTMTILYDGKWVAELSSRQKHTRKGMREIITIAQM
jgi:hypothetical protein